MTIHEHMQPITKKELQLLGEYRNEWMSNFGIYTYIKKDKSIYTKQSELTHCVNFLWLLQKVTTTFMT